MNKQKVLQRFNALCNYLPGPVSAALLALKPELKLQVQEIRLRAGLPLAVTVGGTQLFLQQNGQQSYLFKPNCIILQKQQLQECFLNLCNHSVYAHQQELCEGYLMLPLGHRVGVCGTFVEQNGKITAVRDVSSLNIRIAKEVIGCSNSILPSYNGESLLICGGPGSGKTTLLRDVIRRLAGGAFQKSYRVSVIDSRGELAAVSGGIPTADLGQTCDIIAGCPKSRGIEMALRTQFPEVIAFDELGNLEEVEKILQSLSAGAAVITTAHAGSVNELGKRPAVLSLLQSGAIHKVLFCGPHFTYQSLNPGSLLQAPLAPVAV